MKCEICDEWCSRDIFLTAFLGHVETCPNCPNPITALRKLVADLVHGMDAWVADEDGVPEEAWEAYRTAKMLIGEDKG